jgi:flavoprotein
MVEAWQPLGKHRCAIAGDLVTIETHGELDAAETGRMMEALVRVEATHGWVGIVFDVTSGASLPLESRRLVAKWDRQGKAPAPSGIVGASIALRTIASLVTNAISLVTRKPSPICFFRTKAEAYLWLASQRSSTMVNPAETGG